MYNEYFGLTEAPFSIAPNPQYLYMSDRHREALAHLLYGIKSDGGFILLTGEVGTGKTTVCRCLLQQISDDVHIAFVLNPKLNPVELLATACDDLGITYPEGAGIKVLVDQLNEFLLATHKEGRRTVLIIDEAQNLSIPVLEQLRLLTNLETNQRKLLQIMLIGQPELLTLLAKGELRQLTQRVTARFHLDALNREEVYEYIKHRLKIAGARGMFFPAAAVNRIFKISEGVPRVVNLLCDRALLGTYTENRLQVSVRVVNKAAEEVLGRSPQPFTPLRIAIAAALFGLTLFSFQMLNKSTPSLEILAANPTQLNVETATPTVQSETTPADKIAVATVSPVLPSEKMPSPGLPQVGPEMSVYLDRVEDVTGHGDARLAFNDLFALWGVVFEDQSVHPCEQATSIGLKCYSNLSGLKEVANLNRPIVIGLNQQWLTLSQIRDGVATLISGHQQFEVSLQELAISWNGQYTLFWRAPPAYNGPLVQGDQGAQVDWLVTQMALIESLAPVTTRGHNFNKQLEDRIKRFQLHSGLTPNGTVGVRTWIHMNGVKGVDIPLLSAGEG